MCVRACVSMHVFLRPCGHVPVLASMYFYTCAFVQTSNLCLFCFNWKPEKLLVYNTCEGCGSLQAKEAPSERAGDPRRPEGPLRPTAARVAAPGHAAPMRHPAGAVGSLLFLWGVCRGLQNFHPAASKRGGSGARGASVIRVRKESSSLDSNERRRQKCENISIRKRLSASSG